MPHPLTVYASLASGYSGTLRGRKANAGDVQGACAELSRWIYAAGKQLPGLVQRRTAERQMCEGGLA